MENRRISFSRSVLLADDDELVLALAQRALTQAGYAVTAISDGAQACEWLERRRFDVLLTDLSMPGLHGFELMRTAIERGAARAIVVMTGEGSVANAVRAMRDGASDFIAKPFDGDALVACVNRAIGAGADHTHESNASALEFRDRYAPALVGEDPTLLEVFSVLERVVDTDCSVLVTGESGTGKELVARAIHDAGERRDGPFVTVNCAAIPSELMESEIFGHAKGAFTGATERRIGRFEAADGGTLFLDEIGEMDLSLQSKLLRVLQDHAFTPVGEHRSRTADVRVVAATNRDLEKDASAGVFRLDLYHRLNVVPVELPPLRERRGDVRALAGHFARATAARYRRPIPRLSEEALRVLENQPWLGNVRELRNLIERLVILKKDESTIDVSDLPPSLHNAPISQAFEALRLPEEGIDLRKTLDTIEERLTRDALERSKGNKARAATLLGLKRTTLIERLKRLKITEVA
ncbi:MAG: sigma-54 dependent transcriptional regulator [Myxococcota bacterium]